MSTPVIDPQREYSDDVTPIVAVREADAPPSFPPNPGDRPTASRRGKGRVIATWVTVGSLVVAALVVVFILSAYRAIVRVGGTAAEVATQVAAKHSKKP